MLIFLEQNHECLSSDVQLFSFESVVRTPNRKICLKIMKRKREKNFGTYDDEWLIATGCTLCTATGAATTAGACPTITPGAALATAKTQAIVN